MNSAAANAERQTMKELLQESFYWLDLAIGFSVPITLYALFRADRVTQYIWRLFWVGVCLGLTWEVPIFVLSVEKTSVPIITFVRELPVHYVIFLISHSLWDGGLFLIGVFLIHQLCDSPVLTGFRTQELMVLLIWGQVSALAVEIGSILNSGWVYITAYPWNPVLFELNGHGITLLPQLIWLAAPIVFYFISIEIRRGDLNRLVRS